MGTPVEAKWPPKSGFPATAAFFDLDRTLIARSSTLAFGRSFYRHGYSLPGCYACSDPATDLPLLEAVGKPRVVNPDRALGRIAALRGWPVLSFGTAERRGAQPAGMEAP